MQLCGQSWRSTRSAPPYPSHQTPLWQGHQYSQRRRLVPNNSQCLTGVLTIFKIFLERIMTDTLEDHGGTVSIGGKTVTNLHVTDGINGLAVEHLNKASTVYGMEISAKKVKLITNTSSINNEIKVNGQKLETVTSFKYLGSVVSDEGSKPEILSRVAQTKAVLKGWNQFGTTGAFPSVPRYNWCTPLSHPSSCILLLVNYGPS